MITGGTGHLGSAMSRALAEAGASVVLSSRFEDHAKDAVARLPVVGTARHHALALNHMEPDTLDASFGRAVSLAGQVDVLVNNGHEADGHDWTNVTAEQFTRQLANATGYFVLGRLLRDHLVERQAGGSIILLGSMYGQVASYPDAYAGVCPASPVA
ncbi:MAG: SDR family NAD(P)-dependent oxidoreductase, partial [Planctomycetes bacterium]|nr:SDR family NAD(P)-dependent oxidoreductase [Planctomycetota bacterium]